MTTFVENAIENAVSPSSTVQQSRKQWENKSPSEQISGCRKALYGAVSPILHALANGEEMPVQRLDPQIVDQIEGLFEATFESYEQKTSRMSSGQRSQS